MFIFSAIVPHSPMLIPSLIGENVKYFEKTINGFGEIQHTLYSSKPELLIIFTPHTAMQDDAFTINLHSGYQVSFEEFGDFTTTLSFPGDPHFASLLREKNHDFPISLISQEKLEYGTSVPLYYLGGQLKEVSILPIGYSLLSPQKHYEFGELIRQEIDASNKRVAVIASANLAHSPSEDPYQKHTEGEEQFDSQLLSSLFNEKTSEILRMEKKFGKKITECCLGPISILLGVCGETKKHPRLLSYETPYGIGQMVMDMGIEV